MKAVQATRRGMLLQCGAFLLAPVAASARAAARPFRIGVLTPSTRAQPNYDALFDELQQLGWSASGRSLAVDERGFSGDFTEFPMLAAGLVRDGVDAILCGGDAAIRAAQQATGRVPIIGVTDDFLAAGLVRSLARPGSNTTGISMMASELNGKRQEVLADLVPETRRMTALFDAATTPAAQIRALETAARARGIALAPCPVKRPDEVVHAITAAKAAGAQAVNVLASPLFNITRYDLIERSITLGLPTMHHTAEMAVDGGFAAYGPRFSDIGRLQARLLARVLEGANPADLPVEQPTRFELAINLAAAKAMRLEVPARMIALADRIIE
jgi:putative ABC transport system substrate-binding protein